MIYIDINGRCGNQLFQYAFARKLSLLNGDTDFLINFDNVLRWQKVNNDITFSDQLQHFNVLPYRACEGFDELLENKGTKKQRSAYKNALLGRRIANRLHIQSINKRAVNNANRYGIFREMDGLYPNTPCRVKTEDMFLKGFFENAEYFNDIKDMLLGEFTPKYPKPEKNAELYKIIEENESVCVSFRVWNDISGDVLKSREVCTPEYYEKAIEEMHRLKPNAVFIVFSNDVDHIKNNVKFPCDVYFEDGTDEIWEKLRLMYSCKHFIMATSTFSWWAQYLSRNESKIVISPDRWYADDRTSFLLENDWIKITL